jgi:hypothetical protein
MDAQTTQVARTGFFAHVVWDRQDYDPRVVHGIQTPGIGKAGGAGLYLCRHGTMMLAALFALVVDFVTTAK